MVKDNQKQSLTQMDWLTESYISEEENMELDMGSAISVIS